MSGSSLGAISKHLKVSRSSVQTLVRTYKHHGTTQPSYRSGRRRVLSPRDEGTLVRKKCKSIPEQQQRTLWRCCKYRYKSIYIHSKTSPICRHNLKGRSARKKTLLQNRHKKSRLRFATAYGDQSQGIGVSITKPWPQSYRKCVGRTEKACASKEAYGPDSVTPALSRGMGQNSHNLLWEACGRLPKMFDPSLTIYNWYLVACKLLTHWECDGRN